MAETVSANHVPGEIWTLGAGQGCAPGYANQQAAGVNRWTCIPMKTFQQIQALDFSGLAEVEGLADHYYQLAGGKPTASANVAYGGTGSYSVSVVGGSRLVFDDGNTDDSGGGGSGGEDGGFLSTDPVKRPAIPDRARDVGDTELGSGALPRRFSRAVPTILGGGGDDGGGSGGGGTGGSGGGSGTGSGSGTGGGTSGVPGSGTGGSSDSAIDRLIDLVAAQYAGAGGGSVPGGGVVALPTEISSDPGSTSSGASVSRVLLVIGVVIAAIWYYRKHKKQSAAA